ncbi:tetratricopeptide repeat protein [bacterium]|nr:tetratricopeptide repeat protein [bacterium]
MTETYIPEENSNGNEPNVAAPNPAPPAASTRRSQFILLFVVLLLIAVYFGFQWFSSESMAHFTWAQAVNAFDAENFDEAKRLAVEAIKLTPDDPQLRLNEAEMYFRLDEETEARKQIEEAIRLGKENPDILRQASFLLSRMGQHDGSLFLADKIVDLAEKRQTVHMHSALNQRAYAIAMAAAEDQAKPEQIDQGMKDIERAIEIYGEEAGYVDTRGYLKVFAGDLDGAVKDLDAAITSLENQRSEMIAKLTPQQVANPSESFTFVDNQLKQVLAVLYAHRAAAYEKLGKPDQAKEDQERAENYGLDRKRGVW